MRDGSICSAVLLVLYFIGPFVEAVWQRPLYLLLFLASGVVACIAWILSRPGSTIPLIGASGALSGIMGAFLLRYWRSNVHFFYNLFFIWKGSFGVPGGCFCRSGSSSSSTSLR
jgi:membrane associated rhomboid family serine protease